MKKIFPYLLFILLAFAALWTGLFAGDMLYSNVTATTSIIDNIKDAEDTKVIENLENSANVADATKKSGSGIIKSIDAQYFKELLLFMLPIIETVYNSGNASSSLSGDLRRLSEWIFGYDPALPFSVLKASSPIFNTYYYKYVSSINQGQNSQADTDNSGADDYNDDSDSNDKTNTNNTNNNNNNNSDNNGENNIGGINPYPYLYPTYTDTESIPTPNIIKPSETPGGHIEDASSIYYEVEAKGSSLKAPITLQNETKYKIDVEKFLKEPLELKFSKKGPKILIFHTHTTESYLQKIADIGKKNISSWSRDSRYNVVRAGNEIKQLLEKKYGINSIHNATVHDYPDYNKSYLNSAETVKKILKSYPSIKMVLDIHRDGLGSSGNKLRTTVVIEGKNTAKIMFVVGTAERASHPMWRENLKLALKLQDALNSKYPGLTKPILISSNRYNQNLSGGGLIIEIGGDGNTLDEALESTKYLSWAINEVIGD
ncbi:MAG: stage II sporulation protein P [Clostridiales bacterium]|nr:stage II sporulation protein P [Clostridiales bacterium]